MFGTDVEYRSVDSTKTVVVAEDVHKAIKQITVDEEKSVKEVVDKLLREHDTLRSELHSTESGNTSLSKLDDGTEIRHQYGQGNYEDSVVKASVVNGYIIYGGEQFENPSPAAITADEDIRGEDALSNINGWRWWKFENESGEWVEIDELR